MTIAREEWRQRQRHYLGDISALCFLRVPPTFSSFPLLIAGTGSQIVVFDVEARLQLGSFHVFEGVRVHGIASRMLLLDRRPSSSSITFTLVMSGEKRVKFFTLCLEQQQQQQPSQSQSPGLPHLSAHLTLLQTLPSFTHWVLDFSFIKDKTPSSSSEEEEEGWRYLAVGCSDNSLHIWDTFTSTFIFQVSCSERCLLYSMRLWGDEFEELLIASGTIFNEIVVWKIQLMENTAKEANVIRSNHNTIPLDRRCYGAQLVSRLVGHQGSILCLSWSCDGSKLVSVSDDRSARLWVADTEMNTVGDSNRLRGPYSAGPILFGHGARVWDCCISDSLIVTAGEDCTCRIWGLDGKEIRVIKDHIGRGIWRCLYDPSSSLVVTAGFDSAIKAHFLHAPSSMSLAECLNEVNLGREEVYKVCLPNIRGHTGRMDSKSEYVRCLKIAREDTIYVATNHGQLYCAKISDAGSLEWTQLVIATEEVPVICIDLLSRTLSDGVEDWIAVGNGKGVMKVVKVLCNGCTPRVVDKISWSAEMERQLLGAYWCKSLGCGFLFTSNPTGLVKLWKLPNPLSGVPVDNHDVYLVADLLSPFGGRIMCMDASSEEEVIVCGDLRGNLILFPLPKSTLISNSPCALEQTPPLTYFKGAHGISAVSSIRINRFSHSSVEICSTGGDGCICYLEYDRDHQTLEFVGLKHIKELSLVQSISADHYSQDNSANCGYAVGFSSTDFLIWNLHTETKVMQVKCGGWRRPFSYHLGVTPECCSIFSYVKDEIIYVHKYWVPDGEKRIFPCNLHLQFHGREIHSLCLISDGVQIGENETPLVQSLSNWIATGCEDGTVRLTRYNPVAGNWSTSNLLGEHVGGSAVRSLCFVSKIHSVGTSVVDSNKGSCRKNSSEDNTQNLCLLISVGAKRVLTSWLLRNRVEIEAGSSADGLQSNYGGVKPSSGHASSLSFKWLSSDMPVKCLRTPRKSLDKACNLRPVSTLELEQKSPADAIDNDWRYLSVTAFLVCAAESRLTVCFVVVACSDATLTLRALVLPYRYWFDVACLVPLFSPVLALQNVVIPLHSQHQDNRMARNAYIVISGATDGSIAFWDLSESVELFMQRISCLHVDKPIDFQKRPRTGRGSQGGRWWRSLDASMTSKSTLGGSVGSPSSTLLEDKKISLTSLRPASLGSGENLNDDSRVSEVKPLHVLDRVHHSGVNCLHLCHQNVGQGSEYSIISGGDDQALTFMQFVLLPGPTRSTPDKIEDEDVLSKSGSNEHAMHFYPNRNYSVHVLCQNTTISAHSSAVKGVWTNGVWVFSTGLDQRIRCWKRQEHGRLTEHGHSITSVPEPEALDVRSCGRNSYQVVVAGRGMQMVEFSVPCEENGSE